MKRRIEKGQFADLVVPDKGFFNCSEDEISFLTSDLTMVDGKFVYGANAFADLDEYPIPPAMPDWSPVRKFGGYAAWVSQLPIGGFNGFFRALGCAC
ncbi:putative periplasmic domain protein (plasmid) [Ochrobactrum quorumnocens]|uniref:Putative periplasmic domain protein n=1 Tax=Ochrobactrum quorumnocens TaxID=271865 RepID=A0A248UQH2_9HYPH|nr:hypothetical protein [[Ochrobactrum] quorumnocens]ASV88519.1 putative periplasmic domain protein [[Ochrobactrum] quorumnocens]